jgi:predicted CoA-binding protein
LTTEDREKEIFENYHVVAIMGLSDNPERPSYRVANYLKERGYHIVPVNPNVKWVLGGPCYPDLASIPGPVEIVDIFRRPEDVLPIVEEAIKKSARVIWMQEGVVNEEAASRARAAGLLVVMDKCMRKEHERLAGHSCPPKQ